MSQVYVDKNRQQIKLERQLASGGEGAVFSLINDQTQVAKVYHQPPSAQTIEKLNIMVQLTNPSLIKIAAWPTTLLYDATTSQPAGFLMPRLHNCNPIQSLYNPAQRLKFYSQAGWNFQVRAAANLAAAFDEVHKVGGLVGDVNQSNIQISTDATVRLIDCDSFQILANGRAYLCEVGVAHYIPPELQGKALRGLTRTKNHDCFGLAVLIYQLLFVGRHPYAGRYSGRGDPSFEQLIAEFRFAQGPQAHTWGMAPPPHTPTFADIPPDLGTLFRRAFERGGENDARPHASEWLSALKTLEQSIAKCTKDPGHTYWTGAGACVWCRLAQNNGPEYYFSVGVTSNFAVDEVQLQKILRRLNACEIVDFPNPQIPKEKPLSNTLFVLSSMGVMSVSLQRRNQALAVLKKIATKSQRAIAGYKQTYFKLHPSVKNNISDCRKLPAQYQTELQRLIANAKEADTVRFLRLHSIVDADIPKIGVNRKQTLASAQINTAADIDDDGTNITNIKGFGAVLAGNLSNWKAEIRKKHQFDPATAVAPVEKKRITDRYLSKQQQIFAEANRQMDELESLKATYQKNIKTLTLELQKAVVDYEAAEAELHQATTEAERQRKEAIAKQQREEQLRREAEAKRRAEEAALAKLKAEAERQRQEAIAKQQREEQLQRAADAKRRAEEAAIAKLNAKEERRRQNAIIWQQRVKIWHLFVKTILNVVRFVVIAGVITLVAIITVLQFVTIGEKVKQIAPDTQTPTLQGVAATKQQREELLQREVEARKRAKEAEIAKRKAEAEKQRQEAIAKQQRAERLQRKAKAKR